MEAIDGQRAGLKVPRAEAEPWSTPLEVVMPAPAEG